MKKLFTSIGVKNSCCVWQIVLVLIVLGASKNYAQVSGAVFRDYNANGLRSTMNPIELGIPDVRVSLFVGTSTAPKTTLTKADGTYSFSTTDAPAGSVVRVEFSNFMVGDTASAAGASNRSSVQFAQAPAADVSMPLNYPDDYCKNNGNVVVATPCYVNGDPLAGGSAGEDDAIVQFDRLAEGRGMDPMNPFPMKVLAKAKEVGSVWGSVFQRQSKQMFYGALVRRHVGLGTLGTGGIYRIDLSGATAVTTPFLDVKTLGIDTGPIPHVNLPADKLAQSVDAPSMKAAATTGFGGFTFSEDQKSIWFINLFDRKLYQVPVGIPAVPPTNPAVVKSFSIPNPGCSNGDYRPWGLKAHRGKMYIGVVCSAETSQDTADLSATLYEFTPSTGNYRIVLQFPLNYNKGPLDPTPPNCSSYTNFLPWTNIFPQVCNQNSVNGFVMHPQPIFADVEFEDDGSLGIVIMDRFGLQAGNAQSSPNPQPNDPKGHNGFMSGDLLRASKNADGTFTLESNGKSGDLTGTGVGNKEGPGGGEFYSEDIWFFNGKRAHNDIVNSGLFLLPGSGELLASAMDPVNDVYTSAGFRTYNNTTGKLVRSYAVYDYTKAGTLGKSGGVGDLVAFCDKGLIEIGNRVWFDKNRNGIQDPAEPGIDGLVVTLIDVKDGNQEVAKDTTANGGQFYFGDVNVRGGLVFENQYQIKMDMNQVLTATATAQISECIGAAVAPNKPLIGLLGLTPPDRSSTGSADLRDSDAQMVNAAAIIELNTGLPGQNNHTYDVGLSVAAADLAIKKYLIGDCKHKIGDQVTFKIVVTNEATNSLAIAQEIEVRDSLAANLTFVSATVKNGKYDSATGIWSGFSLNPGLTDTLTIVASVNGSGGFEAGLVCNTAQIWKMQGEDADSKPGNAPATHEDDDAIACVSVPIKICVARKDSAMASAPAGYSSYQWFKDNVKIEGATNATYKVGAPGMYSVKVNKGECPAEGCCPIYVEDDCVCPAEICIPFTVKRNTPSSIKKQ